MTEQIGRFHVRKRLGGGGFGEVFLAEDPTIGRQVAIKVFRPKDENLIAFATSSNTEGLDILRTRFLNEAKILAQLDEEPHIVSVLEFGEMADGTPYYVMPYLPNSLAQELGKDVFDVNALAELAESERPRALPMEQALDAVEQTLKGLAAAHAHGLVHRDIKPGNLMRSEKGLVRIVDFGIAKASDGQHSTVSHLGMGSRNYMAPEQRESAKHVDARADVYATGVVAYRALTGKLPVGRFADPNVAVPALGTAMNAVLLKMLAQDKADRPKDASEALALFQQARKSVGKQDSSEHSGTWAGEQGESGLRDELKPLKARIIAVVGATGFITQADLRSLRALAAVADLDDTGLTALIAETLSGDKSLSAKSKLGQLIRAEVGKQGKPLPPEILEGFHAAGEAVGWDAGQLSTIMQASVAELPKASPADAGEAPKSRPSSGAGTGPGRARAAAPDTVRASGPKTEPPKRESPATPKPRSKLAAALAALLVLSGAGYGVYEWRQAQIAAEQRERALSAAKESEAAAWQQATQTDTVKAYADYLALWPEGSNAGEAKTRQRQREEQARLAQLSDAQREQERIKAIQRDLNALGYRVAENGQADTRTTEAIKQFEQQQKLIVTGTPDEVLAKALQDELIKRDDAAWAAATRADTEAAYNDYQAKYPNGRHIGDVANRIAAAKQKEESRQKEAAKLAEEKRKADEAKRIEEARLAEERRKQEAVQQAEAARLAEEKRQAEAAARNGGFVDNGNGTLRDTQTGLIWTQSDNGSDINWNNANSYCQSKGMRLPSIEELAAIYNRAGAGTTSCSQWTCKASPLFRLTGPAFWSGTKQGSSEAWYFFLINGLRFTYSLDASFNHRALCVGRS